MEACQNEQPDPANVTGNSMVDTLALARQTRETNGPWEAEVSYGGEVDLHKHLSSCKKNPGHLTFVPVDQFTVGNLPSGYHDNNIVDLVQIVSDLTVLVSVKYVSEKRPKTFPGSDKPYPEYNDRAGNMMRTGTGWVNEVRQIRRFEEKFCGCIECLASSRHKTQFGTIHIFTAAHVVYDELEGAHTSCHLFFDRGGTPGACSSTITLSDVVSVCSDVDKDRCQIIYVTHDLDLLDILDKLVGHLEDVVEILEKKYPFPLSKKQGAPSKTGLMLDDGTEISSAEGIVQTPSKTKIIIGRWKLRRAKNKSSMLSLNEIKRSQFERESGRGVLKRLRALNYIICRDMPEPSPFERESFFHVMIDFDVEEHESFCHILDIDRLDLRKSRKHFKALGLLQFLHVSQKGISSLEMEPLLISEHITALEGINLLPVSKKDISPHEIESSLDVWEYMMALQEINFLRVSKNGISQLEIESLLNVRTNIRALEEIHILRVSKKGTSPHEIESLLDVRKHMTLEERNVFHVSKNKISQHEIESLLNQEMESLLNVWKNLMALENITLLYLSKEGRSPIEMESLRDVGKHLMALEEINFLHMSKIGRSPIEMKSILDVRKHLMALEEINFLHMSTIGRSPIEMESLLDVRKHLMALEEINFLHVSKIGRSPIEMKSILDVRKHLMALEEINFLHVSKKGISPNEIESLLNVREHIKALEKINFLYEFMKEGSPHEMESLLDVMEHIRALEEINFLHMSKIGRSPIEMKSLLDVRKHLMALEEINFLHVSKIGRSPIEMKSLLDVRKHLMALEEINMYRMSEIERAPFEIESLLAVWKDLNCQEDINFLRMYEIQRFRPGIESLFDTWKYFRILENINFFCMNMLQRTPIETGSLIATWKHFRVLENISFLCMFKREITPSESESLLATWDHFRKGNLYMFFLSIFDMLKSQRATDTRNNLAIIVSHPHGCSKQVSVGYITHMVEKEGDWTSYKYTAATCPGSSGALVYMLGRGWWKFWVNHIHSGNCEWNKTLNFCGYGFDLHPRHLLKGEIKRRSSGVLREEET